MNYRIDTNFNEVKGLDIILEYNKFLSYLNENNEELSDEERNILILSDKYKLGNNTDEKIIELKELLLKHSLFCISRRCLTKEQLDVCLKTIDYIRNSPPEIMDAYIAEKISNYKNLTVHEAYILREVIIYKKNKENNSNNHVRTINM